MKDKKPLIKNRKVKILLISLPVLVVIGAGMYTAKKLLSKTELSGLTYTVSSEVYQNVIDVSGVVSAAHEQTLQALSSGTVMNVFVKQGDKVKKDDIIIQLDDTTQQYNLAKHDYDMETTKINGSKRELALKQTERLSLVQKINERKVTATFDGIIADIDVSVGDSLEAKDSVGTLVDISYLTADVEVAETDVEKLKIGQTVEFKFPAYNGTVNGYVVGWPAIGSVTSRGATVVKAQLRIDDYPASILPNFSFSGKIKISPDENFLIVSRYAIAREGKQAYVIKSKTGEKIDVKVMPYGKEFVKITDGNIKNGDILKAVTMPSKSGMNKNRSTNSRSGMPGMPGGGRPPF